MAGNIQIGQLPQTNSIVDLTQFPSETGNVTQKIYATSIKDYVTSLAFLNSVGNVTAGNLVTTGSGNVFTRNVIVSGQYYGNLSTATQNNIVRLGNLTTANVTANITSGNIITSKITSTNSLITNMYGTIQTASQPSITSVGILSSLKAGSSGNVVIVSSTPSTSPTTGALVVLGGVGIAGDVSIGGNVDVNQTLNVDGVLTAATANPTTSNTQVATTAWVTNFLPSKANVDGQVFTGTPSLPTGTIAVTQSSSDNSTKLATTAFVQTIVSSGLGTIDLTPYAPKASPTFTGTPSLPTGTTAVTQTAGDNTTKLATTAFVNAANVGLANNIGYQLGFKAPLSSPAFSGTVTGITKAMVGLGSVDNTSDAGKPVSTAQQNALDQKAPLASPTFTGTPSLPTGTTAVTQTAGDTSTKLATTAFVGTAIQSAVPTGTILMWPTATAPSGYLHCNGTAVSRATYSALFALIGTTFGSGDGSSTFNLPNYVNRFPIGAGSIAAVGVTGGTKDAVLPSHTHSTTTSVSDPGHQHSQEGYNLSGPAGPLPWYNWGNANKATNYDRTGVASTGISVTVTNSTVGESATDKNLPPYLGINFIIKA
jgi:microcystin-dependent protein